MSTDYSKMSDFEINKLVALASGKNIKFISVDADDNEIGVIVGEKCTRQRLPFDPCNNPEDAWPIIIENHIAVVPYQHTLPQSWPTAFGLVSKFTTEDRKPLRAAMITFLKMQESKNAS